MGILESTLNLWSERVNHGKGWLTWAQYQSHQWMGIEMTEKLKVPQSGVENVAMRSCMPPRWRDYTSFQGCGIALSLMAGFGHWAPSVTYDHLGFCLYCALELLKLHFFPWSTRNSAGCCIQKGEPRVCDPRQAFQPQWILVSLGSLPK